MNKKDISVRWYRGQGPGGQHKNKTANACELTHTPTGVTASADCRKRSQSYKKALAELKVRIQKRKDDERAAARKLRRDSAIRPTRAIRTYDYSRGVVTDHRTNKRASLKDIIIKGRLDKLR